LTLISVLLRRFFDLRASTEQTDERTGERARPITRRIRTAA